MELATASHAMRNERRDFVEWHRGRTPYVFWALDLDQTAVRSRVSQAAAHLDGLLLEDYARQPHVTLSLCGFPDPQPQSSDEFGSESLHAQCRSLRQSGQLPFALQIGGLSSFISAPYLTIGDAGETRALRASLAALADQWSAADYVPHVTVGLYADAWPAGPVVERLRSFEAGPPARCRIERVSLMGYQPADIGGRLDRLGDYWLATGKMDWYRAAQSLGFADLPD